MATGAVVGGYDTLIVDCMPACLTRCLLPAPPSLAGRNRIHQEAAASDRHVQRTRRIHERRQQQPQRRRRPRWCAANAERGQIDHPYQEADLKQRQIFHATQEQRPGAGDRQKTRILARQQQWLSARQGRCGSCLSSACVSAFFRVLISCI